MSEQSVWEETFSVLREILGLQPKRPKPPPLQPMSPDEAEQFLGERSRRSSMEQMLVPGAMALDTRPLPQLSLEEEEAMIEEKKGRGITHRPDNVVNISEFPKGTLFP